MNALGTLPAMLVDSRTAARALAVSARTLWGLTAPRGPIPVVRINRNVRYRPIDLERYIGALAGDSRGGAA